MAKTTAEFLLRSNKDPGHPTEISISLSGQVFIAKQQGSGAPDRNFNFVVGSGSYFPTQNFEKISFVTSSLTLCPSISPRAFIAHSISHAAISGGIPSLSAVRASSVD